MPETIGSITVPCLLDGITVSSFTTFANDVDAVLTATEVVGTRARVRPSATVRNSSGTAYTAGVAVVPSFNLEIFDNDNMFTLAAPTVLTVNTGGTYLITLESSANMAAANTSHKAEILINGVSVAQSKGGSAITGNQPPNPLDVAILAPLLVATNTISCRITVTGVGNDSVFPLLSASLISYGV